MTIDETFDYLDEIVEKLSDSDISLEDSFALYEKGMRAAKECSEKIDEVEKKVIMINEKGGTEDFGV